MNFNPKNILKEYGHAICLEICALLLEIDSTDLLPVFVCLLENFITVPIVARGCSSAYHSEECLYANISGRPMSQCFCNGNRCNTATTSVTEPTATTSVTEPTATTSVTEPTATTSVTEPTATVSPSISLNNGATATLTSKHLLSGALVLFGALLVRYI